MVDSSVELVCDDGLTVLRASRSRRYMVTVRVGKSTVSLLFAQDFPNEGREVLIGVDGPELGEGHEHGELVLGEPYA